MALISKNKRGILGEKLSWRFSDLRAVLDKAAIKSHMTPHPFYRSRRGQSLNDLNLSFIHLDAPTRDDTTQYDPLLYHEMTLFPIQH